MARLLGLVLAVTAGVVAALLLGSGVSATYAGRTASCTTVINAAAVDTERRPHLAAACHDALVDRTALAGAALLACVAGATVGAFAGREPQPA